MSTADPPERPNVLLVVTDDQRFDTIGALGNDAIETPHLDGLVERGCTFTHAHNAGSTQGAVCIPARAMIHSGHSLFHLEDPGSMDPETPTLGERLGDAGYRTFATGKWHNGIPALNRSFDEARAVFPNGMGDHWDLPVVDRHPLGEYPDPQPYRVDWGTGEVRPQRRVFDRCANGTHSSELFADAAIEFIRSHVDGEGDRPSGSDDRPFFCSLATTAPHDPRTAPGEYLARYDHDELSLPESFQHEHPFDNGTLDIRDENLAQHPRDPAEVRRHLADYYAMITHLDAQVGRVLETLRETGELANTIVVFTADHGLAVGRHGLMGKQNCYDHSVRVPLIIAGPGLPEDVRRDALTNHTDLYPTLCDMAGVEVPDGIDGHSLRSAIEDGESHRNRIGCAYGDEQRAIRTDGSKLIEYLVDGQRHVQLFDVAADPHETTNLADDRPETVASMREELREWQSAVDDPLLEDTAW
jgi:arylsulfatase A-like enzyme